MNIGCDIEDISRFNNKTLEKDEKFLNRIFTKNELDYCFSKKDPAPYLCARFCAKEATIKALGGFYQKFISYNEIEILKKENGAPYINILIDELKKHKFNLTLSHEKEKAIAFVIIE